MFFSNLFILSNDSFYMSLKLGDGTGLLKYNNLAYSGKDILDRMIFVSDRLLFDHNIFDEHTWSPYSDGLFRESVLNILESNYINETTHDDPGQPLTGLVISDMKAKDEIIQSISNMHLQKPLNLISKDAKLLCATYVIGYSTNDSKKYFSKKSAIEFFSDHTNSVIGELLGNFWSMSQRFKGNSNVDEVHSELEKLLGQRINPENSYIHGILPFQDLFNYSNREFMVTRNIDFKTETRGSEDNILLRNTNCFRMIHMPVSIRVYHNSELLAYTFFKNEQKESEHQNTSKVLL